MRHKLLKFKDISLFIHTCLSIQKNTCSVKKNYSYMEK